MPVVKDLATSSDLCTVMARDADVASEIWFKTDPLNRKFCYRALQLQLITNSRDQGYANDTSAGSWSWFEILVLENSSSTTPRVKDDKELVWRSHCNNLALFETTQHFGMLFDRRHELLNSIEVGNVLAVRVCARFQGWCNEATSGKLVAKLLDEDTFIPNPWSLSSTEALGIYTVTSPHECHVTAENHELASKIWFATPPLDEGVVPNIEELQLFTRAHNQLLTDAIESGSWTWFDVIVLDSSDNMKPKIKNGRSLEWKSHTTVVGQVEDKYQAGLKFDRTHELLGLLEVGDIVAVRVCAQFEGRKHLAHEGRLTVRVSTKGPAVSPPKTDIDWETLVNNQERFKEILELYLNRATPEGAPPAYSAEGYQATAPLRADSTHGAGGSPLKLLSLDGGGVRGISSLEILHAIEQTMIKLTGDASTKPCDYFDMIAGTSTGGLIAIMLGRLKMSIKECMAAYHNVAGKIFEKKGWNGYYDPTVLEAVVKDMVRDRLQDENASMMSPESDKCRVFVVACQARNMSNKMATHIRTYVNKKVGDSFTNWSIWQAARATSAAPTFFPSIMVNDVEYIDGGMGFNNPVILLYSEAGLVFGRARPIECLVTIGTGMSPDVKIDAQPSLLSYLTPSKLEALKVLGPASIYLLTNGELAHLSFQNLQLLADDSYYRFNFGEKNQDGSWKEPMQMDNWKGMHELQQKTQQYVQKDEAERVDQCAKKLTGLSHSSKV